MKKWFKFFYLSFFSHSISKESVKRSYTNVFLSFLLVLLFLFAGFTCGATLPFFVHYGNSPDFTATARAVLANADVDKRIDAEIENGVLKLKTQGGEYTQSLLVNTFVSDADKQTYSVNGYNVVVDTRPAGTLAEVEAYCVSNDGKNTVITYQEYLTLSEVARLNFDFKLCYTGNALVLSDETVKNYRAYVDGLSDENKAKTEKLASDLSESKITKSEYNSEIYKLYFTNYYPEITEYESTSDVPLLRNYYYHQYISKGIKNYLFIFDDYMTGSFETKSGIDVSFYGFYSGLENGALVASGATGDEANRAADTFIKNSYKANWLLNAYAYLMNVLSLAPFIALMLMVATLLAYSILKLCNVESIATLGAMLKIVGSYSWFSGAISVALTVITMFFVQGSMINALPLVLFFAALVIRSVIFAIKENKLYKLQSENREVEQTEV
ncbi:MAG: hypothetical protein E7676_03480 [Ruminococcaceae bacterium]|nr:hypothetical protein [Oscillospiraceae bacterium]